MESGEHQYELEPMAPPAYIAPAPRRIAAQVPFTARLRRALHVLGIGVLVAAGSMLCMMAVSWVRSRGAVEVVQAQVENMRVGKVEEAYALFSVGYQSGVTLPMFRRWLRRQGQLHSAKKLQFWGRSVWGETAVLWGSFRDDLGHSYPVRYLLIREHGVWRIDAFRLSTQIPESSQDTIHFLHI